MENERNGMEGEKAYPYEIDKNCIPHCDSFMDNGYTKEEMKLTNETKKILDPSISVSATAVRVPVVGGHSEAVNIEFENEFDLNEVKNILANTAGISLQDQPEKNLYPMPKMAEGKNEVFVGRIRRDESQAKTLNCWIVADNLRKGAATNAVQIGQLLISKGFLNNYITY
jgi:aspartate-semialdehyde dehydrogenase